jgi:spore coat protein U-like protein
MNRALTALMTTLALCAAPAALAAVTVNCTASASSIAFGIYNPFNTTPTTSTGNLRVTCTGSGTGSTTITVGVTLSTGLSGNFATRKMFAGANSLDYNIFWSTAYTQIMGDGSGGSFAGTTQPFTIFAGGTGTATGTMYGRVPAQQDVAPGSYVDTILVTVTY